MTAAGRLAWAIALCALPAVAAAGETASLARLWAEVQARLDAAAAARAPVPPTPVAVRWGAAKLSSVELGAPLLALDALDADGDGRDELVALTRDELVLLRAADGRAFAVAARLPLPASPASIAPRDPVGSLWAERTEDGPRIEARSSAQGAGLVATVGEDGALVPVEERVGYPLCGRGSAELVAGRNHFGAARWQAAPLLEVPAAFYALACGRGLVDPEGLPIEVAAAVAPDGSIATGCTRAGSACPEWPSPDTLGVAGDALAIADVDRDGRPELVFAAAGPPGEPDRVSVWSLAEGAALLVHEQRLGGGVPAIVVADIDGDGAGEVVAAVRLGDATRVGLWALNR